VVQYWPLYRSDLFKAFGYGHIHLPNTDRFFDNMLSFPFWSGIPKETLRYMVESIRGAVERLRRAGS